MALRNLLLLTLISLVVSSGCLRYSFTGASIPDGVNSIYIPFFPDRSNSGISDLSDRLNRILVERFINQSKLQLASSEEEAEDENEYSSGGVAGATVPIGRAPTFPKNKK